MDWLKKKGFCTSAIRNVFSIQKMELHRHLRDPLSTMGLICIVLVASFVLDQKTLKVAFVNEGWALFWFQGSSE